MTKKLTVSRLASELNTGKATAQSLLERSLERIADPAGEGKRIFTRLYTEQARAEAHASDILRKAGLSRSPIEGMPVSVKDLFDVAGETTLAGSVVLNDAPAAKEDAVLVKRLRAAGAVIIGKTNMTEFAYSGLGVNPHYGTPLNPWDRKTGRIPGGSSSGAAVSVSDGMAIAGIGSDTGGSIRIPAALCGLTGFKPTARRVSAEGSLPLSTYLDSFGAIAPTVACCAVFDAILSGENAPVPAPFPLKGVRIAVPTTLVQEGMDKQVAASFDAALKRLSAAGAQVSEIAFPLFDELAGFNAKGGFTAAEAFAWHEALMERSPDLYDPRVISRIRRGGKMTAADFIELVQNRVSWIRRAEAALSIYDAFVMPVSPVIAPSVAEVIATDESYGRLNLAILRNSTTVNFMDGCGLSIPCQQEGEAPVGLMLAGTAMSDRKILSLGLSVEACLKA